MFDKVVQLFEEEMDMRMKTVLEEYATHISKKHGVSLELLLRDIPSKYVGVLCKGHKNCGEKCTFRAVDNGYCRHHMIQFERIRERTILPPVSLHTHGPEQMYVRGCPACESSKELIDLSTVWSNE